MDIVKMGNVIPCSQNPIEGFDASYRPFFCYRLDRNPVKSPWEITEDQHAAVFKVTHIYQGDRDAFETPRELVTKYSAHLEPPGDLQ